MERCKCSRISSHCQLFEGDEALCSHLVSAVPFMWFSRENASLLPRKPVWMLANLKSGELIAVLIVKKQQTNYVLLKRENNVGVWFYIKILLCCKKSDQIGVTRNLIACHQGSHPKTTSSLPANWLSGAETNTQTNPFQMARGGRFVALGALRVCVIA